MNLGVAYAMKGKNTCIIDYDFQAPHLYIMSKVAQKHWINDFLNGKKGDVETK